MIAGAACVSITFTVLLKITKGLGGPQGLRILIMTLMIGAAILLLAYAVRHKMLAPTGVVAVEMPREEVLALGEKARGTMPDLSYLTNDMARVATFAAARRADGTWDGLAAGTVLQVESSQITEGDTWVTGIVQGGARNERVAVHSTFLERYLPVVLERTMEVSDLRLMMVKSAPRPGLAVSGWLRNITSQTLSQCVVTCVFQDKNEHEVDTARSEQLALAPMQLVRFQTTKTDRQFNSIAIQITHATPDGLRNYLSTIVIKRSSMQ